MSQYKYAIVIDGMRHYIEMLEEYATEEEAQAFLKTMQDTDSLWIGLATGDMISMSGIKTKNVYFEAVKY